VNVAEGPQRGYVILRPPVGPEDFILTPTRRSPGIEDPTLKTVDAPNYFEMAWNARSVLADGRRAPPRREQIALAVNSRLSRTQDQMHIHIGCLTRRARESIDAMQPELSTSRWRRLRRPIADIPFWGRIVAQETLAGVNPFRLAMALPEASEDRADMTIAVAATLIAADRPGFVILAAVNDRLHSSGASDLLASSCP
jgi:CDP-diacylglycerol pyrophosphatase